MKLFVDTWGWLTLRDRREARHEDVTNLLAEFRADKGTLYTTDYVLDETYTLLFKRLHFTEAKASMTLLDEAIAGNYLELVWITPKRFAETQNLRLRLHDKPNISFTDLTSVVVMAELGINRILTGDAHFTHVGMGFEITR